MLDSTDQNPITTSDELSDQAQCPVQDQAKAPAACPPSGVEDTIITMRVDDVMAFVTHRVFDTIGHIQISSKIREGIKRAIRETADRFIGQRDSYKVFPNIKDRDTFMDSIVRQVAEAITHEAIAKLNTSFRRLEVANALRGKAPNAPLASLSAYELTLLAIKAYKASAFQSEAQFREELLMSPNLPIDEIILNLTHLISAHERLYNIAHALALCEIFLEYL